MLTSRVISRLVWKILSGVVLGFFSVFFPFSGICAAQDTEESVSEDFACLLEAYPNFFKSIEHDTSGNIFFVTLKGERIPYRRSGDDVYDSGIYETLHIQYPLEPDRPVPQEGEDPGRIRSYALLRALYGSDKLSVEQSMRPFLLFGEKIMVPERLLPPLIKVREQLQELFAEKPHLERYVHPAYGQYWRYIAKTERLSPHCWGIALDFNPDIATYWQWSKQMPHPDQVQYPSEIVRIFERNGFIWGGKWRHYDLMHFEYRPEILIAMKKQAAKKSGCSISYSQQEGQYAR